MFPINFWMLREELFYISKNIQDDIASKVVRFYYGMQIIFENKNKGSNSGRVDLMDTIIYARGIS